MKKTIWIGFDPREADAFAVARHSIRRHLSAKLPINGLVLDDLRARGLYRRPTSTRDGRLWDDISEAPMSTEFAISRFLVKELSGSGWALFVDADFLALADVWQLFALADPSKAVMVVKHDYRPADGVKMDGQVQTAYPRKNWSSCMLLNCDHPANGALTVDYINSVPGRDLHRFAWLDDDLIGELPAAWNVLVGHTQCDEPKMAHFTDGVPSMAGYENCQYAAEWRKELQLWAK